MQSKSLLSRKNNLSNPKSQLKILTGGIFKSGKLPFFDAKLKASKLFPLRTTSLEIFQINLGYMCNQVCKHCHVDAGPDRKEIMTKETMCECLAAIETLDVKTVDLTGGAPEMNPNFKWLIGELSKLKVKEVIVRSNLTIILANKKYNNLPNFFKLHNLRVVSSLPFYKKGKTDNQRGDGVFSKSIKALQMLNEVGYGNEDTSLQLDLVYNPSGAFLPPNQSILEKEYKQTLLENFNIRFNNLLTITNLPISRFLEYLLLSENYEDYMYVLVGAFNPMAAKNVMCRNTISVDFDGFLYDCDFNQMLGLKINTSKNHISEISKEILQNRRIITSQHCYGCTAGEGSSCQGAVVGV